MNIFDTHADVEVTKDIDSAGYSAHESGLYPATVKTAYIQTNQSTGSASIVLILNVKPEGQDSFEFTTYECIVSGTTKGDYYMEKKNGKETGKKIQLPSKKRMNSLCELLLGTDLSGMFQAGGVEEKAHKVKRDGKEVVETLPTITAWQGLDLHVGIRKILENKQVKQGNSYVPTAEIRETNDIDKFFDAQKRTNQELTAGAKAEFFEKWESVNAGKVVDKTKKVEATAGVPNAAPAAALNLNI